MEGEAGRVKIMGSFLGVGKGPGLGRPIQLRKESAEHGALESLLPVRQKCLSRGSWHSIITLSVKEESLYSI